MWHLSLEISSETVTDTKALAACLATDCDTRWLRDNRFQINLEELHAKDMRALWNTRLRGLIATDSVLKVFGKHS